MIGFKPIIFCVIIILGDDLLKLENEITVKVMCDYETLVEELKKNNFEFVEEYDLFDQYMIDKDEDIYNLEKLEILKKCILVREIQNIKKVLLYKYKKYNDNGDILEQGKIECPITDIEKGIKFMETINYKKLFKIHTKNIIYKNEELELDVQIVNGKYILIEVEIDIEEDIEKIKDKLNSYNLSIDKSNYFYKKAEIMLNEIL